MKLTRRGLGHLLIRSHHSFACFALLASLACSAALICSLARLITYSGAHGKDIFVYELNASISYSLNSLHYYDSVGTDDVWSSACNNTAVRKLQLERRFVSLVFSYFRLISSDDSINNCTSIFFRHY